MNLKILDLLVVIIFSIALTLNILIFNFQAIIGWALAIGWFLIAKMWENAYYENTKIMKKIEILIEKLRKEIEKALNNRKNKGGKK